MRKRVAHGFAGLLCLALVLILVSPAFAGKISKMSKDYFLGESAYKNDGSFKFNYLELYWDENNSIDHFNYQLSAIQSHSMHLKDVEILDSKDGEARCLWKQSDEETMNARIDIIAVGAVKTVNKRKFFAEKIPFDPSTAKIRWTLEIKDKTYHVIWDISTNEISHELVE